MQFGIFHWLRHHGLLATMPHSAFLLLVYSNLLYFGDVFNKTVIPFMLVGYEIGYSRVLAIYHFISNERSCNNNYC